MRFHSLFLISLFVMAGMPPFSDAAYRMGQKKPVRTRGNAPAAKEAPSNEDAALTDLSTQFGIEKSQLLYFRRLRHGYEEIVPALIVAREAQVEVGRILNHRVSGQSWKEIAGAYSVDLKPLNKEVLEILTPLRKKLSKQALTERPVVRTDSKP